MSQPARGHQEGSKFTLFAAFAANLGIAISKFVAGIITGSSAMLAEGVHSVVDTFNSLLMLYGIHRSREAASKAHPFGHGKELYFWSLIVAVLVFGIGGGLSIYEGIRHFLHPSPIENPLWNYVVLGIAFALESTTFVIAYRHFKTQQGRRSIWRAIIASKDPTNFVVLLEDGAATIGIVIAFIGIQLSLWTGNTQFDSGASVLIGILLCVVSTALARESKGLLVGESADPETVERIRKIVCSDPSVKEVVTLLTMHMGPDEILLNLDIQFDLQNRNDSIAGVVERLEKKVKSEISSVKYIFIEAKSFRT
jgi:cation diffusion facilitator family transporter